MTFFICKLEDEKETVLWFYVPKRRKAFFSQVSVFTLLKLKKETGQN